MGKLVPRGIPAPWKKRPSPIMKRKMLIALALLLTSTVHAQRFSLQTVSDTLSFLVLQDGAKTDRWRLLFPVYQMCVGDVDGDGREEAIVGVVKTTRFDPVVAKRLFIFKNHHGRIRAMWMGSKLGGTLVDFRFKDGKVVTLQSDGAKRYAVVEHHWRDFGLGFTRFLVYNASQEEALRAFQQ